MSRKQWEIAHWEWFAGGGMERGEDKPKLEDYGVEVPKLIPRSELLALRVIEKKAELKCDPVKIPKKREYPNDLRDAFAWALQSMSKEVPPRLFRIDEQEKPQWLHIGFDKEGTVYITANQYLDASRLDNHFILKEGESKTYKELKRLLDNKPVDLEKCCHIIYEMEPSERVEIKFDYEKPEEPKPGYVEEAESLHKAVQEVLPAILAQAVRLPKAKQYRIKDNMEDLPMIVRGEKTRGWPEGVRVLFNESNCVANRCGIVELCLLNSEVESAKKIGALSRLEDGGHRLYLCTEDELAMYQAAEKWLKAKTFRKIRYRISGFGRGWLVFHHDSNGIEDFPTKEEAYQYAAKQQGWKPKVE